MLFFALKNTEAANPSPDIINAIHEVSVSVPSFLLRRRKNIYKLNTDLENTWDILGNYQIIWRRFFQMSRSGVLSLQSATITGSFEVDSPIEADQLWVIPIGVSYGNLSQGPSATSSGGSGKYTINVSATAQNLTIETHTITVNVLVIAVKTKS